MKGSRAFPRSVLRPAVSQSKRCFSSYSRYLSATRPTSHITSSWNNQALYTQSNKSCMEPSKLTKRYYASQEKVTVVPPMGDSISEGEITEIAKKTGESVEVDEVILTIETDKVAVPIRAEVAGTIAELYAAEGEVVKVGQKLFKITEGAASAAPKQAAAPQQAAPTQQAAPAQAPPTQQAPPQKAAAPTPKAEPAAPKAPAGEREYRVKIPRMRARVAERLKGSQNTYAMLTTFQECDMYNLMQLRDEYKEVFEKTHGVKLGFMSAFVKASAAALKAQPIVNAVMDEEAIIYRDYVDISVAVATPKGLVVPVLRDCDQMSFAQVEKTIGELGKKAKEEKITLEDMAGGTFTISNGGVYGSMMGTPIVNPPQSAILGMHGITKRAVVINDEIKIRPIMYLALTYDHRLIDGKDAVTFLRRIKHGVEDPRRLLLDL